MNGLPYYKAYPRDFFEGTVGLDFEIKAAYRLLLDLIYLHGGRLMDDQRFIAGHLGCSVKKWLALRNAIMATGKIVLDGNHLANHRADKVLDEAKMFQSKQRDNASGPRKNKNLAEAVAKPKPNHTDTDTEREEREPNGSPKKSTRGSRIQPDWQLPRSWGDEAVEKGLPVETVKREAERFKNYWLGVPGQKGIKLDWQATWRNWIDKRIDETMPRSAPQTDFWTGKALV